MSFARIPLLLAFLHAASAEQPSAPSPIAAPLRELPWGQLNFLHSTDTHGWHGGHLQEAQYAADWGDYISFAHHLHARADAEGSDLLLIETGDRVEGNGLYDASDPKGKYSLDIIKAQSMDVVTPGNHELYQQNTSEREYSYVVPGLKDAYIASNLDIFDPKSGERKALAQRFRKFTTKNQGIRVVAFGFVFDFRDNANNTVVIPVEEAIKEQWFKDAVDDKEVDLFLVAGHVPVRDAPEFEAVYKAIRAVNWDTPIVFFGGHTHIRDYRKFEKKAWGLESGRYMETLGFLSISGLNNGKKDADMVQASPKYKRLYIDNNLYSLRHHSGTNQSSFPTELGHNVSQAITTARKEMKLDHTFGCAPHHYWLSRVPYPSDDSLLSWLETEVLQQTFRNSSKPSIILTNTGAMRFDIFKGPFTIDSTFLVSPFTSGLRVLRDVPYKAASQVLPLLNNEGPIVLKELAALASTGRNHLSDLIPPHLPARPASLDFVTHEAPAIAEGLIPGTQQQQSVLGTHLTDEQPQLPGYTTKDDAGTDGDDTIHQPIKFYGVPNCIATNVGFPPPNVSAGDVHPTKFESGHVAEPETVDLIYNEFIENWILLALQYLGEKREVEDTSDVLNGKSLTDIITDWIKDSPAWKCDEDSVYD